MGRNLMSTRNRNQVIEVAQRTVAAQLREPGERRAARRIAPPGGRRRSAAPGRAAVAVAAA